MRGGVEGASEVEYPVIAIVGVMPLSLCAPIIVCPYHCAPLSLCAPIIVCPYHCAPQSPMAPCTSEKLQLQECASTPCAMHTQRVHLAACAAATTHALPMYGCRPWKRCRTVRADARVHCACRCQNALCVQMLGWRDLVVRTVRGLCVVCACKF